MLATFTAFISDSYVIATTIVAISLSGFLLKVFRKISWGDMLLPPLVALIVIGLSAQYLRDFSEAMLFFGVACLQFAGFIFVSRMRNRDSIRLFTFAGLLSNGGWYATMSLLVVAGGYWYLIIPYVGGIAVGRLVGAQWSQLLEEKLGLSANFLRSLKESEEAAVRRYNRQGTAIMWFAAGALVLYTLYGALNFSSDMMFAFSVVVVLGALQNFLHSLLSRLVGRGKETSAHNTLIALVSILAGTIFVFSAVFLFSRGLPAELFLAYVLTTVIGSTYGNMKAVWFEVRRRMGTDTHVVNEKKSVTAQNKSATGGDKPKPTLGGQLATSLTSKENRPYVVILALMTLWLVGNESILAFFGAPVQVLALPLPVDGDYSRALVLFAIAVVFTMQSALHGITSSAGNRNNATYHLVAILLMGTFDFMKIDYFAINPYVWDIIPVAILSGALGALFGRIISAAIETPLKAVMDVSEPKTAKT